MQTGLVVSTHGRHCVVETPAGGRLICHPRGKKLTVVVGDRIRWLPSQDEGVIERIEERRNLLYRQDEVRTKSFAANLDQALILIAAQPEFWERQLARALLACEAEDIQPLIALNKADLTEPFARAWARLAPYRAMGYTVLGLAVKPREEKTAETPGVETPDALACRLHGHTTLILGPSGAGKSTLINRLVPGARAQTGDLSQSLGAGRHTTTHTTWYWLDSQRQSALIDSPGFQEFGLSHLDPAQLAAWMPDLKPHAAGCRFYNCTHLHEPGCGVISAVGEAAETGSISPHRYKIYRDLMQELTAGRA
ncbi:MAG: ribosome small subunit-dependent GTPase A [Burkholderiaceae bacterium]|jgi:ribosome biogenesis GTPase|nr:ribosome small subunit-dependent GTPase A [Burkholderiaceae bacterium]